jgi:hypothetical protein
MAVPRPGGRGSDTWCAAGANAERATAVDILNTPPTTVFGAIALIEHVLQVDADDK